jgi:hypothetical protein
MLRSSNQRGVKRETKFGTARPKDRKKDQNKKSMLSSDSGGKSYGKRRSDSGGKSYGKRRWQ